MIDPTIALGVKPIEIQNPINSLAKMLQLRQAEQDLQSGGMKMDEYKRNVESQNALRQTMLGFGANPTENQALLYKGGHLKEANEYGKNQADLQKIASEAEGHKVTAEKGRNDLIGQAFGYVRDNPTLEAAHGTLDALQSRGLMTPEGVAAARKLVTDNPTTENIRSLATRAYQAAVPAVNQIPKENTIQLGNRVATMLYNPMSRSVSEVGSLNIGQSPDNAATVQNAARTAGLVDARARAGQEQAQKHFDSGQSKPQYMETDQGLVALPKTILSGQAPVGIPVMGADGQPLGKALKQIPPTVNNAIIQNNQSIQQLDRALKLASGENVDGMLGDKSATGLKGYLPNGLLTKIDPKGVDLRAIVADIGSLKLHDRSGAAVTASESPRLMPFIPLSTDDNAPLQKKLNKLRTELMTESKSMQDIYSKDQGYKPSPIKSLPNLSDIHLQADQILRGGK